MPSREISATRPVSSVIRAVIAARWLVDSRALRRPARRSTAPALQQPAGELVADLLVAQVVVVGGIGRPVGEPRFEAGPVIVDGPLGAASRLASTRRSTS